ncbi:hypothetical protein GBN15_00025 [Plesiomonas shigelloides]|nr:hypothetical protein GBN15_00025 [Plesiomonas shigelloides]
MQGIISKTFGGLSIKYYLRQIFFSIILASLVIFMQLNSDKQVEIGFIALIIINTLLYPYSRFAYESIIDFIMGDNVFFVNSIFLFAVKFITMTLCWFFAIFITPISLAYLYYHHSKATN